MKISKLSPYISLVLGVFAGVAVYVWRSESRPRLLEMYVFDLKSSQSVFMRTPDDKRILVNGGPNSEIVRKLTEILPFYSKRLDFVIATATDDKNVSGLINILERYSVDNVVIPAMTLTSVGLSTTTDQAYSVFLNTIKNKDISVREVKTGDKILFEPEGTANSKNSVYADVLFPNSSKSFKYSKTSSPRIILRVSYGLNSVIFLNDATVKIQKSLVASPTDVLVIQGGASSENIADELAGQTKPKYLVYSQASTLSNTRSVSRGGKADPLFFIMADQRFNIKEKGTIELISDGVNLKVE